MPDTSLLPPLTHPSRPRGGQKGNHNAIKHGFYSHIYTRTDQKDLESHDFQGLQEEIAVLRLLFRQAASQAYAAEDQDSYNESARIVIGLMAVLNATLRTQIELNARGSSEFDIALQQAVQSLSAEIEAGQFPHVDPAPAP